jgi:hypothetical protein
MYQYLLTEYSHFQEATYSWKPQIATHEMAGLWNDGVGWVVDVGK